MFSNRRAAPAVAAAALLAVSATAVTGCDRGSDTGAGTSKTGCHTALAKAKAAVRQAEKVNTSWNGPTSGPQRPARTVIYVAQTMTNPGVAGCRNGVKEAAKAIGWKVRVIDGEGTPAGIQAAFSQAIALKPAGIVIGGFDPNSTARQVAQANAAQIRLIGWHAVASPGPSKHPRLFSNITTKVTDVAKISADWIIAHSNGTAGAVVFTDASIPFAKNKSELIKKELATCAS